MCQRSGRSVRSFPARARLERRARRASLATGLLCGLLVGGVFAPACSDAVCAHPAGRHAPCTRDEDCRAPLHCGRGVCVEADASVEDDASAGEGGAPDGGASG